MADVYSIQTVMTLGGNLAPELAKILKNMQAVDKAAKSVEKSIGRWPTPAERTATAMGRVAREMGNIHRASGRVEREVVKTGKAMAGLRAPASGLDREMAKWATAIARPLAEMRSMRTETRGVATAARGVSRAIDNWAGRIDKATASLKRMSATAASVHVAAPNVPTAPGGRGGGGTRPSSSTTLRRRHRGGYADREGSHLAGTMGVYGGLSTMEWLADQGAGGVRENIRAKNAGLTADESARLSERAGEMSQQYPSLSKLSVREQGRLLIPNVGNFDAAMQVLPEYLKGQVALQTMAGPDQGAKDMEAFARYIDVIGRSMSVEDTKALIDGYVRARQLDPEAVRANDYVNAAKSAATTGKGLSVGFWSQIAPALFSQQGGARTGTDIASAYQNTAVGRATVPALLAQEAFGLREGMQVHTKKNGKKEVIRNGNLTDETLYNSNPFEWAKKHVVPRLVAKGMLPEGYARGDYSQDLTDQQRADSGKALSQMFSNRRGANIFSMMIQDMDQIEQFVRRWSKTRGTADVLADQKNDPYVGGKAIVTQAGNAGSALASPAIPTITEHLNRLAAALGGAADTLEKHPVFAQTTFGTGAGIVGGAAAAGATALTIAAVGTLSVPALIVGAGAAVTIATLTIPWDKIWGSMGFEPGIANGQKTDHGVKYDPSDDLPGVAPLGKSANDLETGRKRAAATQGLGLSPENASAAIEQAAAAIGRTGTVASTAAPGLESTAGGINNVKAAALEAPGALNSLAASIRGAFGNIMSGFGKMGAPQGGAPALPGAAPSGGAPKPQSSVVPPPRAQAPIQVASTLHMDGRTVARAVTSHQVASADTRNGTQSFDDNALKTPVGHSAPTFA